LLDEESSEPSLDERGGFGSSGVSQADVRSSSGSTPTLTVEGLDGMLPGFTLIIMVLLGLGYLLTPSHSR